MTRLLRTNRGHLGTHALEFTPMLVDRRNAPLEHVT